MPQLRDGTAVDDARLNRLVQFDEQSRQYPVRDLFAEAQQPKSKTWSLPNGAPVLDQGTEGACVGFGVTNELRFRPTPVKGLDETFAHDKIYWEAQKIDPWDGGSYPGATPKYEGTSVLAGVKTAASQGYYGEYRWAFGEGDLALAMAFGPVILGLEWWTGMFTPDGNNYLHKTGKIEGGHCILCVGISVKYGYYTLYNSWGPSWGHNGRAKVSRSTMAALLASNGEACVITQRFLPKT